MPLTNDDARTIWRADIIPSPTGDPANPAWQPDSYLKQIYLAIQDTQKQVAALSTAVSGLGNTDSLAAAVAAALPPDSPVTTDQLVEALKEALGSLNDQPSA